MHNILSKDMLMKYMKIQRADDLKNVIVKKGGFVTSSKFIHLKNLHAYGSLHLMYQDCSRICIII